MNVYNLATLEVRDLYTTLGLIVAIKFGHSILNDSIPESTCHGGRVRLEHAMLTCSASSLMHLHIWLIYSCQQVMASKSNGIPERNDLCHYSLH